MDGLKLGSTVHFGSDAYRAYRCSASEQFADFTWCEKQQQVRQSGKTITWSNSILHDSAGTASYINRYIRPATLSEREATSEIDRLSQRFGEKPQILRAPTVNGSPKALIASWGRVQIENVEPAIIGALKDGKTVKAGLLLDYLGDFQKSARMDLPIYTLRGGPGFVWSASFDESGKGHLRFFAVDASAVSGAARATEPPNSVPESKEATEIASKANPTASNLSQDFHA